MTLEEIARLLHGRVAGNPRQVVKRIAPLEEAASDAVACYFGTRPDVSTRAGCVVTGVRLPRIKNQIIVNQPRHAFLKLLNMFRVGPDDQKASRRRPFECGSFAFVEPGVRLGRKVSIGAFSYIGKNVVIGSSVRIEPRVTVLDDVQIGNRVFIHSGAVIGGQGFSFVNRAGRHQRIPHIGRVVIEDDVDIGANVTIDRGTLGDTVIGKGTKIDSQVHIGHNVKIGRDCLIVAQVGISGSVRIGNNVILAGQVGVKDHVEIGDRTIIYAKSAVLKSVPKDSIYSGNPARDHHKTMKAYARLFQESKDDSPQADPERLRTASPKRKR